MLGQAASSQTVILDVVILFVDNGYEVNAHDESGVTPLLIASEALN